MNVKQFLAQLPADHQTAIEMLDGFIIADNADPQATREERQSVVTERIRRMLAREKTR